MTKWEQPLVMPSVTRRQVTAWLLGLAATGFAGYRFHREQGDVDVTAWTPTDGTWPLPRYDPANTGHNPNANSPRALPERRVVADVPSADGTTLRAGHLRPLVGADTVATCGSTVALLDGDSGETVPLGDEAPVAGFGPDGHFYAAHTRDSDSSPTRTVLTEYAGESAVASHEVPGHPQGLTIGATAVYLGTNTLTVSAVRPDRGRVWTVDGRFPAVGPDGLLASNATDGAVVSYGPRGVPFGWLQRGPGQRWRGRQPSGRVTAPAVADGRVVLGAVNFRSPRGEVVAYDVDSGNRLFDPRPLGEATTSPAVVGNHGYFAVSRNDQQAGIVISLDLATGETRWRDDVGWEPLEPVTDGDTVVVAGRVRSGGLTSHAKVRAYDADTGAVLWTHTRSGAGPNGLALVEDRILVGRGSTVDELR